MMTNCGFLFVCLIFVALVSGENWNVHSRRTIKSSSKDLEGAIQKFESDIKSFLDVSQKGPDVMSFDVPADVQAKIPQGLPRTRAELQNAFGYAALSVKYTTGKVVNNDSFKLTISPSTLISSDISRWNGMSVSFEPPLIVRKSYVPIDIKIKSARWSFSEQKFSVEASGLVFDSFSSWATTTFANRYLIKMIPARIKTPGYNPITDPNLAETIKSLTDTIKASSGGDVGSVSLSDFNSATATLSLDLSSGAVHIPISAQDAEINIPERTTVTLTGRTTGSLTSPLVQSVILGLGSTGIEIRKSSGVFAPLMGLTLKSITISSGGKCSLDYDLHVEDAITGVAALGTLAAVLSGHGGEVNTNIEPARLQSIRATINDAVTKNVDPKLRAMISTYDNMVPGMSLMTIFGTR